MTGSRLVITSSLYATAGAIGKVAALATVPFFTRALGAEAYGLADLAVSFAALLTLLARFGGEIPVSRARALAAEPRDHRHILGEYVAAVVLVAIGIAVGLVPLSGWISSEAWNSPNTREVAVLSLALIPLTALQLAQVTVLRIEGREMAFVVVTTIDLAAHIGFSILLVALGGGVYGLVAGHVLGSLVGAGCASLVARKHLSLSWSWRRFQQVIGEGLPYLPAFVAFVTADQLARVITAQEVGAAAVGQLALAFRISSVMALAVSAVVLAWGPTALRMAVDESSARTFRQILQWYGLLTILATVVIGSLAPELVLLMSGPDFLIASTVVPALTLAAALVGALFILATAAGLTGNGAAVARSNLIGAATQVAISVVLARSWGIPAIGIAAVLGRCVGLGMLHFATRSSTRMPLAMPGLALAVTLALVFWMQDLNVQHENTVPLRFLLAGLASLSSGLIIVRLVIRRTIRFHREYADF